MSIAHKGGWLCFSRLSSLITRVNVLRETLACLLKTGLVSTEKQRFHGEYKCI